MWRRFGPAVVCYVLALALLAGAVGRELGRQQPVVAAAPTPAPAGTPAPAPGPPPIPAAGEGLAVGVTEFNANLVATPAQRPLPEPWAQVRDALGAIRPAYFRLVLDWASIQPSADAPANLEAPHAGCMREVGPCLGWAGVRDQLRALASRQREGGWQALTVVTTTPDWAAVAPSGCERDDTRPRNRAPRPEALPAYRQLILDVLQAAREEGAELRFWSAWNEPNHPAFISPQRAECKRDSPSLAPAVYGELARTLIGALEEAPGEQQVVIGETAGYVRPGRYASSVPEFIAGLPQDVVCASTVWSQHDYIGGDDPVEPAAEALAARGCPHPHTIWITETGVGAVPRDLSVAEAIADEREGCRALHKRLVEWFHDPRVTVAFQYTVREDDKFPTGLFSTDLTRRRPALAEWTAWGGAREPTAPPPPSTC
jgi:hypothetical protein